MREIKFKAFCKKENKIYDVQSIEFVDLIEGRTGINVYAGEDIYEECKWLEEGEYVLMQFTGLKDKNGDGDICLFEGDILSLDGKIIGNIYENENLLKDESNIIIKKIGTKDWRRSEKEAMDRGFGYPI